ncbi:DUF6212 domain-containing protein [Pararoseomonas indoligenes]|uniref:Uncharacterized protein n=1 Tax=Roseomonas indoligenes TaxID=2820811 RepID=A0A940N421_9PROT|nr:DUF6212 domain-containing protein [Pararoseomonas indoligenes]MBP0494795.1 hypothetical protein [Pararoseomonas indoligenes]
MLHADPLHLPRLASGRPLVIVAEGVMDPSPLATPSLDVWMVSQRQGLTLLHPAGTRAPDPSSAVPVETPPAATLALVASERLRIGALSRWWQEAAGLPAPPFVLASTGQAALPGVLALVTEALTTSRAREAEASKAIVAARQEMELLREAMSEATPYLAHRPPAEPRLAFSGEVGDGPPILGAFRQPLGTGLAGLAAIAVHPAGAGTGQGMLRLRLIGGESGRVVGCWAVPARALSPGWLTLDLPTPLGPVKETAVLEVTPQGPGLPGLSRDARWSGIEGEHGVAFSAWAGTPGSRYLAPAHWMPEEVGLVLPANDVPLALPSSVWAEARALEGEAKTVALGEETPRPMLRAAAKGRAVLLLPHLHLPGLDRLRIGLGNAGAGAEAAAWVYPLDSLPGDVAGLDRLPPGAAGTGWRGVPEEGLELSLPLSVRLGGRAGLAIALRAGPAAASVEIERLAASASRAGTPEPVAPAPGEDAGETAPAAARPAASAFPAPATRETNAAAADAVPAASVPAPVSPPVAAEPAPAAPVSPAASRPEPPAPVPRVAEALRPAVALSIPLPSLAVPPPGLVAGGTGGTPASSVAPPAAALPADPAPLPVTRVDQRLFAPQAGPAPAEAPPAGPAALAPVRPAMEPPRATTAPVAAAPPLEPAPALPRETAAPTAAQATAAPAQPPVRVMPTNVLSGRAPARYEVVRLHQHLPGASYRHLDVTVVSLASGPTRWPAVRVKVQSKDGEPRMEFRQATGWPQMFRDWLGRASDKFGPFLRISAPELRAFLDCMTDERDAAMIQALLAVLPRALEDACRQAGLSVVQTGEWMETAKALQAESRPAA